MNAPPTHDESEAVLRRDFMAAAGVGALAIAATTLLPSAANAVTNAGERSMTKADIHDSLKGSLVVVARWTAAAGQAERIADILAEFLPKAQAEPGVKLFVIGRDKADANQFLFYEVFADDAAFQAHQASDHFKTLIAGQALPLLADRQRSQYALI